MRALKNIQKQNAMPLLIAAASVLFVLAQIVSVSHAQKYGDDAHTHNGVQCLFVGAAADDDTGIVPAAFVVMAIAFIFAQSLTPSTKAVPVRRVCRQAPRAPPVR